MTLTWEVDINKILIRPNNLICINNVHHTAYVNLLQCYMMSSNVERALKQLDPCTMYNSSDILLPPRFSPLAAEVERK